METRMPPEWTRLNTSVEGEAPGKSVVLTLKPGRLPRLDITDENGVTNTRCIGLQDLLNMLDRSTVLEQVREEARRHVEVPELPRNPLLVDYYQFGDKDVYQITGWMDAFEHPFIMESGRTYLVPMRTIVWRARWIENTKTLNMLSLAIAKHANPNPNTALYRWPFSNMYSASLNYNVCWSMKDKAVSEMSRIPEEGVMGFLSTKNNGHLFGQNYSHQSDATSYESFLAGIERKGVILNEWLIPHEYATVRDFHDAGKRSLVNDR